MREQIVVHLHNQHVSQSVLASAVQRTASQDRSLGRSEKSNCNRNCNCVDLSSANKEVETKPRDRCRLSEATGLICVITESYQYWGDNTEEERSRDKGTPSFLAGSADDVSNAGIVTLTDQPHRGCCDDQKKMTDTHDVDLHQGPKKQNSRA